MATRWTDHAGRRVSRCYACSDVATGSKLAGEHAALTGTATGRSAADSLGAADIVALGGVAVGIGLTILPRGEFCAALIVLFDTGQAGRAV